MMQINYYYYYYYYYIIIIIIIVTGIIEPLVNSNSHASVIIQCCLDVIYSKKLQIIYSQKKVADS